MKKITLNEDLRLASGAPVYHVFFDQELPLVVGRTEGRAARQKYNYMKDKNPDLVRQLSGKTFAEAREILHNADIEI
jgi:hypothetical protein